MTNQFISKKAIAALAPIAASLIIWPGLALYKVTLVWTNIPWEVFIAHHIAATDSWWPSRIAMFQDYLLELWFIPVAGAAFSYLLYFFNREARKIGSSLDHNSMSGADQISKLHDLMKSGALTKEEFDAQKKKILSRAA